MKIKILLLFSGFFIYSFITYAQEGILDTSFANNGIAIYFGFELHNSPRSVMQPDGKILIAGTANQDCALTRFLPSGVPDSTFGTNGISIHKMNQVNVTEEVKGCALQPDGKIVVAGSTKQWNNFDYLWDIAVLRFNTDGAIDNSFGNNGKFATDVTDNFNYTTKSLEIQPDGKVLISGSFSFWLYASDPFLMMLNTDGSLDSTFGVNGFVNMSIDSFPAGTPGDIALQADGKIIVTGDQDSSLFSIRYFSNGSVDSSYGINGIAKTNLNGYAPEWLDARSVVAEGNDKILIGVNFFNGISVDLMILQYTSDGILDSSFGDDGIIVYSSPVYDACASVFIQPDGRIIIAGSKGESDDAYPNHLLLLRYENNGLPDESFGVNGMTTTSIGFSVHCTGVFIDNEGKIILTGSTHLSQFSEVGIVMARYTTGLNVGLHNLNDNKIDLHIYPNPVSDQSTIQFSIRKNAEAVVNLLDLDGKTIKVIGAGKFMEGTHTLSFSRNGLVTGVYFIEVKSGSEISYQKVVVQD